MPSGREMASPTADLQKRRHAVEARKAKVIEKAQAMDDAPVAVVFSGRRSPIEYWPSKEAATAAARQYRALPEKARTKTRHARASHVAALRDARRAQEGGGGIADARGPRKRLLDRMAEKPILKMRSSVGASLVAIGRRICVVQPPHDESVAENHLVAGEATSELAWMRQLVADLKEKEKPCARAEIEYINVRGFVMERDAYDFIRFDLGMPLPDLCGAGMRLWSWGDPPFAPPPPSPK